MQTYIYDHYGYIVDDDYAKAFTYRGYDFKLESHDKNEMELSSLRELVRDINRTLFQEGVDIIENTMGLLGCVEESSSISLVGVKKFKVTINDLNRMHKEYLTIDDKSYSSTLLETKILWETKIDLIENTILPSFDKSMEYYNLIYSVISYAIGLAENALTYLNDIIIDYGSDVRKVTIAHKRLYSLNSFDLLNPFNLVLDSPMRDIAELYKNDALNNADLIKEIEKYKIDTKEAMILFSRVLFPSNLFDILEDYYIEKRRIEEEIITYYYHINKKMKEISSLHQFLINNFGIRPIEWLIY